MTDTEFFNRLAGDQHYRKQCGQFYREQRQEVFGRDWKPYFDHLRTKVHFGAETTIQRAVTRFENGETVPRDATFEILLAALDFKTGDFLKEFQNWLDARPPSAPTDKSHPAQTWIARAPYAHNKKNEEYAEEILADVRTLRDRSRALAEGEATKRIINVMGALTERFGATSSWLFLNRESTKDAPWIDTSSTVQLRLPHNTGKDQLEIRASDPRPGIVWHVVETKRPYLMTEPQSDPYYRKEVESTESEIAVPILVADDHGGDQLIGVLNLESKNRLAFLECHQSELMAAATKLAPEILVLHHLTSNPNAFGWHPETHGWALEHLLDSFCAAVAGVRRTTPAGVSSARPIHLPRPSCTVWYRDPKENVLFVRGTARFDYEYVRQRTLCVSNSFTGKVATVLEASEVGHGRPKDLPNFDRIKKAAAMGMNYAFCGPIYRPGDTALGNAVGAISLYFFEEELKHAVGSDFAELTRRFPFVLVQKLAEEIGELVDSCQRLRSRTAGAYLRYRLHAHALPDLTDFDTVKEVILECLDADNCSLFGIERLAQDVTLKVVRETPTPTPTPTPAPARRGILRCLATSGLQSSDGTPVDRGEVFYDLDKRQDYGVTAWLAEHPKFCVRCRSMVDPKARDSGRVPNQELVPKQQAEYLDTTAKDSDPIPHPANKYREIYSQSYIEHRPFLGLAVAGVQGDGKAAVGVVRVLRKPGSKPFVAGDETLLRRLADEAYPIFQRWASTIRIAPDQRSVLCGARYPCFFRVVRRSFTQPKLDAMDHLGSAFAAGTIWNRRHVDSVLLDLMGIFGNPPGSTGRHGALIANLRVRPNGEGRSLRVYAMQALLSADPPAEASLRHHENAIDGIGARILEFPETAFTFDSQRFEERPAVNGSERLKSGVCVPVRFLSRNGVFTAVLSLECDDMELLDWRNEHLEVIALAGKKLDFIGRDNCFSDHLVHYGETWQNALDNWLNHSLRAAGVAACWIEMGTRRLNTRLSGNPDGFAHVIRHCREWPSSPDVRWNDRGGFRLDLWYGAFKTGFTLIGHLDKDTCTRFQGVTFTENMRMKMVELSHLWNRFVSSRVGTGVKPLFRLLFQPVVPDGPHPPSLMVRWKGEAKLAPRLDFI